jgi:hypothetical protein
MKYPKRSQYKYAKSRYRVRNWAEYEAGLQKLGEIRFRKLTTARPIHLLIDSTGLRIHVGHLRKPPKRRAWRKLHLAVDADTGEIVATDLTGRRTGDSARVPALLGQIEHRVASVSADGAYDTKSVYEAAQVMGDGQAVRVLIPPGRNARLSPRDAVSAVRVVKSDTW